MPGRPLLVALASLLASACGAAPVEGPTTPTTPASDPVAAPASAAPTGRCVAGMARKRPASGWTQVGALVVTAEGETPTSVEVRDAAGKVLETRPAPKDRKEFQAMVAAETCRLGGMLSALEGEPPKGPGKQTLTVALMKPIAEDETGDVARILCKEPVVEGIENFDESQKMRVAFDVYEERLTTNRWRAWLRDLFDEHGRTEGEARVALRQRAADELHEAATKAGMTTCWFEQGLRKGVK